MINSNPSLRNTPAHYDAPMRNPAPGSVFAYYVTGLAIIDAEPRIAPWYGPVEVDKNAAPLVQDYWRRANPEMVRFSEALAQPFVDQLLAAFPTADVADPATRALIEMFTEARRSTLAATFPEIDMVEPRSLDDVAYRQELGVRAVFATAQMLNCKGQKAVYSLLNEGARGVGVGLTRHNVDSARKTIVRWVNGPHRHHRERLFLQILEDQRNVEGLEYCRAQAAADRRFATQRGADLAWAVHEHRDLNESVHRARNILAARARSARKSAA